MSNAANREMVRERAAPTRLFPRPLNKCILYIQASSASSPSPRKPFPHVCNWGEEPPHLRLSTWAVTSTVVGLPRSHILARAAGGTEAGKSL